MVDNQDDIMQPDPADDNAGNHKIPSSPSVDGTGEDEAQFEEPLASPAVTGEEDVFSGDSPVGEPADIDSELEKVGLSNDDEGIKPLGEE